jgi:uncharacterized protein YndB with AHSA1/START domain
VVVSWEIPKQVSRRPDDEVTMTERETSCNRQIPVRGCDMMAPAKSGSNVKLNFEQNIDADLATVWVAFIDPDNIGRWQQNFESYTHKSGVRRQPGATAELVFNESKKKVILKETITERRDPDFLASRYESAHGTTMIVNHFEAIDATTTRWTSWCNFTFKGMMKIMSVFVTGSIRKRTEGDMQRFKLLVETTKASEQV